MRAFDRVSDELVGATIVSVSGDRSELILDDGRRVRISDPWAVEVIEP